MKSTLYILVVAICLGCHSNTPQASPKPATTEVAKPTAAPPPVFMNSNVVEIIRNDFNGDGVTDSLLLQSPPLNGDPGQFSAIRICISGIPAQTFFTKDVWDFIEPDFITNNALASKRVYAYKSSQGVFLLLFGFKYGSGRDYFDIIRIHNQQIQRVLSQAIQEPVGILALGKVQQLYFVGRPDIEEGLGVADGQQGSLASYTPYMVYDLSHACIIDTALTEEYNRQHYVWAGMKACDSIKVLYAGNSQPKLWKP